MDMNRKTRRQILKHFEKRKAAAIAKAKREGRPIPDDLEQMPFAQLAASIALAVGDKDMAKMIMEDAHDDDTPD